MASDQYGLSGVEIPKDKKRHRRAEGHWEGYDRGGLIPYDGPKLGDMIALGEHILMCGDAGNPSHVARLMGEDRAKMVITSPPYADRRNYSKKIANWFELMGRVFNAALLEDDVQILINLGFHIKGGRIVIYWNVFLDYMNCKGYRLFDWYVWDKCGPLPGAFKGHLMPQHEFIFHFNRMAVECNKTIKCKEAGRPVHSLHNFRDKDGNKAAFNGNGNPVSDYRVPSSVIRISKQANSIGKDIDHPAVFPVALPEFLMPIWTNEGDIVYEPFCGSGSTILAGQKIGRKVRAMEISPQYVGVAMTRFACEFPDVPMKYLGNFKGESEDGANYSQAVACCSGYE